MRNYCIVIKWLLAHWQPYPQISTASDPRPNAGQQGGRKGKKREKEISFNQTGLLDTVSRYAAAMARIISWQHKLLQNKEAEKRIFFFSLLTSFSPTFLYPCPHPPSLLAQHLTRGAARGQLFFPLELSLMKCRFTS